MKRCNNITIRILSPKEDALELFEKLFPCKEQKLKIRVTRATAADNKTPIIINELFLDKDKHTNAFLDSLTHNLDKKQKELLLRQTNRLDDQGNFFLRLDRGKLLEDTYLLTDKGDCVWIRLCVAAYPKNKQNCYKIIKEIFS